jgi:hypothetical protein
VPAADRPFVALLNAWYAAGSQRLAPAGSNVYGSSPGIALMDAWWPLAVKAIFEPGLGPTLWQDVVNQVLSLPSGPGDEFGGYDWTGATYTDLRDVLLYARAGRQRHARVPAAPGSHIVAWDGSYSRIWCGDSRVLGGGASVAACRAVLLASLGAAIAQVEAKLGSNPSSWQVDATCAQTNPPSCDQEVLETVGAIATPPFPWQDRGTYHQIVELNGHRPG